MGWEGNGGGRSQVLVVGESEAVRLDGMVCAPHRTTAPSRTVRKCLAVSVYVSLCVCCGLVWSWYYRPSLSVPCSSCPRMVVPDPPCFCFRIIPRSHPSLFQALDFPSVEVRLAVAILGEAAAHVPPGGWRLALFAAGACAYCKHWARTKALCGHPIFRIKACRLFLSTPYSLINDPLISS
jgi:hypothetical protein